MIAHKMYDKAIEYDFKALKINDSMKLTKSIANNYLSLGIIYTGQKQFSLALAYLNKAHVLYNQLGSKFNAAASIANMVKVYDQAPDSILKTAGINPAKRYQTILQLQHRALSLAIEVKDPDFLSNQWKALSGIYEKNKQFDSALYAYKEYSVMLDSIAGSKKRQDITRQEMRFEAGKKEAVINTEHAAALKKQQFIRNTIIGGAAILLITGMAIFSFYKRRRDAVEKQKEAELRSQVSETEMKALRSQMNPHFIFNSLNSISDYITKHDTKVADEYLNKFSKLMRLILENSEKKEVSLAEDLIALELYMQLESLRMNNKFTYEIKVDEAIDKQNTLVPPLILQPFVENSIWHGIARKEGHGRICVSISREGDMINCMVEDDGIGRQAPAGITTLKDSTGKRSLGMKITMDRIDIINKEKKTNALVKLTDLEQGTRVEVKLPLELSF
ncbi:MAG: histidine kinase, partial [Bacteroidota bacterium]